MKWFIGFLALISFNSSYGQEIYLAQLKTMNPAFNGTIAASVTLYKEKNKFLAYTRFFSGFPNTWHMQNVMTGTRCPTWDDDLNQDGLIDVVEGNKVWGNILLPLDSDLNSQQAGRNTYPLADGFGSYFYEQEADYSSLIRDLKATDRNPYDNVVKLKKQEKLNFEGKVVLIQGIIEIMPLPETVATANGFNASKTFPVACGVMKKLPSRERQN